MPPKTPSVATPNSGPLLSLLRAMRVKRRVTSTALAAPNGEDDPGQQLAVGMYEVDAVVRRATALQLTPEALRSNEQVRDS